MARDEGGAPRRPQQALQQHKKKSPPSLKNQLRSIDRLLQKVTEKQQRASLELRKAELEKAQVDSRRAERERKLAVRYHKVKFFGAFSAPHARVPSSPEQSARRSRESRRSCARPSRRKAGCASSSAELRSRLTPAPGERGAAREAAAAGRGRRVHAGAILSFLSTRRSSRAAQHFPRGEKYVSLFTEGGDVAHAERERARLRALVKERAASAASTSRPSPHPHHAGEPARRRRAGGARRRRVSRALLLPPLTPFEAACLRTRLQSSTRNWSRTTFSRTQQRPGLQKKTSRPSSSPGRSRRSSALCWLRRARQGLGRRRRRSRMRNGRASWPDGGTGSGRRSGQGSRLRGERRRPHRPRHPRACT